MSKTVTAFRRPHCLAPVVGGGGYLVADLFRVNRSFRTFWPAPVTQDFGRKNRLGPPRGFPHVSVAIRLKLGKIPSSKLKASGLWPLAVRFELGARPEREAAI